MRSPVLLAALLALGLSTGARAASAQASATTATTITVDVVAGLSILKISDIDFGVVPAGSGANTLLATDPGAGGFHILGDRGRDVTVTITAPPIITSGGNSLPFAAAASVNETADDPAAATPATVGAGFTMKLRDQAPARNGRLGYVYVHGQITVAPAATPGVYTGVVTITAEL
ncbi:MAG: DUF4402 domain-containing protein [Gemmatimonadota bacterium]